MKYFNALLFYICMQREGRLRRWQAIFDTLEICTFESNCPRNREPPTTAHDRY